MGSRSEVVVFDISGHGLGHLAQVGPVIHRLKSRRGNTEIVVRSRFDRETVQNFVFTDVVVLEPPLEPRVASSGDVFNLDATAETFGRFHEHWEAAVDHEAKILGGIRADYLVSNIPYVSLEAARRIGLPTVAFCSMNWLEIFRSCSDPGDATERIAWEIGASYESSFLFLQPRPHLPMAYISKRLSVGPIARLGRYLPKIRSQILQRHRFDRLVLVTSGGMPLSETPSLPALSGVHWLLQGAPLNEERPDVTAAASVGVDFIDLVATVDAIVAKDSYGAVVEAGCHGKRLIMDPRPGWPEGPSLHDWASAHIAFVSAPGALRSSEILEDALRVAFSQPDHPPVQADGAQEAADVIAHWIDSHGSREARR